jgi:parallel beta-helix repeat protein
MTIVNNTCSFNHYAGMSFIKCDNTTVANNTCNNNKWFGILFYFSNDSLTLINNTFYDNGLIDICFDDICRTYRGRMYSSSYKGTLLSVLLLVILIVKRRWKTKSKLKNIVG